MKTYKELLEDIEVIGGGSHYGLAKPKKGRKTDEDWRYTQDYYRENRNKNLGKIHPGYTLHKSSSSVFGDRNADYFIRHEKSKKVVGHIETQGSGKNIHIDMVKVHPEHNKKVVGRSLAAAAYEHLHKMGHNIHSGSEQSVGGASIWKGMMKNKRLSKHIDANVQSGFGSRGKKLGRASRLNPDKIWVTHSRSISKKHGVQQHNWKKPEHDDALDTTLVLKGRTK